jgi:hypothetical protein
MADILANRIQIRSDEVQGAQGQLNDFLALPPMPPRKLSGCCAGRNRRTKRLPVTAEDWAALG